jgi:hypothetical protein
MNTPWGQSDSVEMVADGIWDVGTPSHGGVKLSCKRQALLPANAKLHNFFKTLAWWEEDCEPQGVVERGERIRITLRR